MNTVLRTVRTGLVARRESEVEYPGLWDSWNTMRTEAHRELWEDARRRLGLPYRYTAAHKARIDRDALFLARCDNWDAVHPEPIRAA